MGDADDSGVIPFEQEPEPDGLAPSSSSSPAKPQARFAAGSPARKPCPACGVMQPGAAESCMTCGHSFVSTSAAPPEPKKPSKKAPVICPQCGYDASGIIGDRCPECGVNLLRAIASRERRDRARSEYQESLKTPLWMLIVGLVGATLTYGLAYGWVAAIGLDIFLLFKIVIAIGVFWVLSIVWIGQGEYFGGLLLKVAGIYATLEFAGALFSLVPILGGFVGWVILGLVYLGMLQHFLDLEPLEAIGVAVTTFMVRGLLIIFLIQYFI